MKKLLLFFAILSLHVSAQVVTVQLDSITIRSSNVVVVLIGDNNLVNIYPPSVTPEPPTAEDALELTFDDIANASLMITGDASDVSDWNTFFDLPTNGTPFTSVEIDGNTAKLYGGAGITIAASLFDDVGGYGTHLTSIVDNVLCIVAVGYDAFGIDQNSGCPNLVTVNLPSCITAGNYAFYGCHGLVNGNFPSLESAGDWCFDECWSMINHDFPSLITANYGCFYWNSLMDNPNFPVLNFAGESCFGKNDGLITITLPLLDSSGVGLFEQCPILQFVELNSLIEVKSNMFAGISALISFRADNVQIIFGGTFAFSIDLIELIIPLCTDLGGTTGDDSVFSNISGNTIAVTCHASLLTCNGGAPDGDLCYLHDNNTITVNGSPLAGCP